MTRSTGDTATGDTATGDTVRHRKGALLPDQSTDPGSVDENGLWWCVPGAATAIRPALFHTLVSVMSAADRVGALRHNGFSAAIDDIDGTAQRIVAQHPSGLRLLGHSSLLTAALCYWEDYDLKFASSPARHTRQKAAFEDAYDAVRAVGLAALGEPTLQGRDRDELRHRWSAWRIGDVLLAVHQAVGDAQFGLSIQMDARRYPADAALRPRSPFVDWMWSAP